MSVDRSPDFVLFDGKNNDLCLNPPLVVTGDALCFVGSPWSLKKHCFSADYPSDLLSLQ